MAPPHRLVALAAIPLLALAGCGDNSNLCGPGTLEREGVCEPDGANVSCTGGTRLNEAKDGCVLDPSACQGGTVLVGNACIGPHDGLVVDVLEGPEPNGLGRFGELSPAPAGLVALKPVGMHFVLKGRIAPFEDRDGDGHLDADADTYAVTVTEPSLVSISADGVHGLVGAFEVTADVGAADPLAAYARLGLDLTGDTSRRQLFLPAAGTYLLAVVDARTLLTGGGAVGAVAGEPTFEYYVTIDALDLPAPTAIALAGGTGTHTGTLAPGEVVVLGAALGNGDHRIALAVPDGDVDGAFVVMHDGALRALGDETTDAVVGGLAGASPALVVVDPSVNTRRLPTAYEVQITPAP